MRFSTLLSCCVPSTACVVLGASGEGPNGRLQSVREDVLAHYTIEPRAAGAKKCPPERTVSPDFDRFCPGFELDSVN